MVTVRGIGVYLHSHHQRSLTLVWCSIQDHPTPSKYSIPHNTKLQIADYLTIVLVPMVIVRGIGVYLHTTSSQKFYTALVFNLENPSLILPILTTHSYILAFLKVTQRVKAVYRTDKTFWRRLFGGKLRQLCRHQLNI